MNQADRHPGDTAGLPGWIERARLAEQSWPVVLVVAASSVAIPWYFGWQPYDLRPMLLTLLAVGIFCYSATQLIARWAPLRLRNAA